MSQTKEPRLILRQKKDHLPHDIVLNILANLPVKSVLRFRCVSKTWDFSITTPNFISTHLNLNLNNNNNNLAYLINNSIPFNSDIPIFIDGYDHKFNRISEYPIPSAFLLSNARSVSSCNGLVCLTELRKTSPHIYLWNPSIRKLKRLPDFSPTQRDWLSTGFAYQSNTNDYKVVMISNMPAPEPNHHWGELGADVYTLSSNSWRRVGMSLTHIFMVFPFNNWNITFVCGALHWLGDVFKAAPYRMILSFDVNSDKFKEMALPDVQQLLLQGLMADPNSLMVFKGKLAFITLGYLRFNPVNEDEYNDFMSSHTPHSCFIWVMGEYGVHESWSKLFFVQFENVVSVRFFGCTSRGELLVIKKVYPVTKWFVVVSLDLETLHEKDLGFQKVPDIATTFVESLVLLDEATELSG
ncbi:F-box/kelch-repeat protein At3g06240-like [Quercus suber]|uniref:F-box/kelch-repeat protein At3g06240-like n=1 Tax=Quercus suber TaxID=58331 RepID=UPI0032DED41A